MTRPTDAACPPQPLSARSAAPPARSRSGALPQGSLQNRRDNDLDALGLNGQGLAALWDLCQCLLDVSCPGQVVHGFADELLRLPVHRLLREPVGEVWQRALQAVHLGVHVSQETHKLAGRQVLDLLGELLQQLQPGHGPVQPHVGQLLRPVVELEHRLPLLFELPLLLLDVAQLCLQLLDHIYVHKLVQNECDAHEAKAHLDLQGVLRVLRDECLVDENGPADKERDHELHVLAGEQDEPTEDQVQLYWEPRFISLLPRHATAPLRLAKLDPAVVTEVDSLRFLERTRVAPNPQRACLLVQLLNPYDQGLPFCCQRLLVRLHEPLPDESEAGKLLLVLITLAADELHLGRLQPLGHKPGDLRNRLATVQVISGHDPQRPGNRIDGALGECLQPEHHKRPKLLEQGLIGVAVLEVLHHLVEEALEVTPLGLEAALSKAGLCVHRLGNALVKLGHCLLVPYGKLILGNLDVLLFLHQIFVVLFDCPDEVHHTKRNKHQRQDPSLTHGCMASVNTPRYRCLEHKDNAQNHTKT
mmetsp:Transcript_97661/g.276288  ORF Transcript_97661/g.276288 Transcript_97661/m.276288 type:complete len:531 (+) Transcript_97661:42-1634(+)|eukprot:CAMPEP_0168455162 /NCGR_PEP_ID=MMETSP0228-20121227/50605_1 /TAXON_ID=133427 /ORGANISM="Protoceratium reticulatum, Strain CCCM 535 (=CCMP 1889)" /LENGTH=530 /DNA_ID=CAMNT_0008469993 /DNA_START=45 /DNA_END=1637 /DNA_ORIENTATION=+